MKQLFLNQGELYISNKSVKVTTILGSCVAIIFFEPRERIGAICHALLPTVSDSKYHPRHNHNPFDYLDFSFYYILNQYTSLKISPSRLQVKVFGGSQQLKSGTDKNGAGFKNVEEAEILIQRANLNLVASSVGGSNGRKIIFYPNTGEVYMKHLGELDSQQGQVTSIEK